MSKAVPENLYDVYNNVKSKKNASKTVIPIYKYLFIAKNSRWNSDNETA